jgi:hypothetical protein
MLLTTLIVDLFWSRSLRNIRICFTINPFRYNKWIIKINQTKSGQVTFTTPQVNINNITETKYLGLHLDQKFKWQKTRQNKAPAAKLKTTGNALTSGPQIQVICRKILQLYKCIMKPIWTYGIPRTGMGLHKTIKHQNNSKIPVQSPALNSQCRGRATAQAISRRLPTAAARVQNRVW